MHNFRAKTLDEINKMLEDYSLEINDAFSDCGIGKAYLAGGSLVQVWANGILNWGPRDLDFYRMDHGEVSYDGFATVLKMPKYPMSLNELITQFDFNVAQIGCEVEIQNGVPVASALETTFHFDYACQKRNVEVVNYNHNPYKTLRRIPKYMRKFDLDSEWGMDAIDKTVRNIAKMSSRESLLETYLKDKY